MDTILGILIGIGGTNLYYRSKITGEKIRWYVWGFFGSGACSILLGIDTLFSSYAEHEVQAAWMGLGLFGCIGIILIIAGWRLNTYIVSKS